MQDGMVSVITNDNPLDRAVTRKARSTALLRLFGFLGISIGLAAAALVFKHVLKISVDFDTGLNVRILLIVQALQAILMVVVPTAVMVRLGREPATYFGWGRSDRLRQLVIGLVAGAGFMTVLLLILEFLGVFFFGSPSLPPHASHFAWPGLRPGFRPDRDRGRGISQGLCASAAQPGNLLLARCDHH